MSDMECATEIKRWSRGWEWIVGESVGLVGRSLCLAIGMS